MTSPGSFATIASARSPCRLAIALAQQCDDRQRIPAQFRGARHLAHRFQQRERVIGIADREVARGELDPVVGARHLAGLLGTLQRVARAGHVTHLHFQVKPELLEPGIAFGLIDRHLELLQRLLGRLQSFTHPEHQRLRRTLSGSWASTSLSVDSAWLTLPRFKLTRASAIRGADQSEPSAAGSTASGRVRDRPVSRR